MRVTTWRRNASLRKPTEGSNMTAVTQRVVALKDLASLVNQRVGVSRWHRVTQEQVNLFAEATGDHQWIHVDPERARTGPFGTTIAHGYLTLSLSLIHISEPTRRTPISY